MVSFPIVDEGTPERPTVQVFQFFVGSLLRISRCTMSDITFAVHRITLPVHMHP
ncbi:Yokozuna [Phytophthora megakarya]|uniref:Yokozuna n=1 Tax=Phytophthora megakarya TaxID=4795 RepID=A0A225UWU1_9STRA|nr:Yokozuna [Phytophthora megakarya]